MFNTILLGTVSVACLIGAIAFAAHSVWILCNWPNATAEILRYRITRSDGAKGQKFYHAVYRFETLDGRKMISTSSHGSWRRIWKPGALVAIRYWPDNPRRTEIMCFANLWLGAATFAALSIWILGRVALDNPTHPALTHPPRVLYLST